MGRSSEPGEERVGRQQYGAERDDEDEAGEAEVGGVLETGAHRKTPEYRGHDAHRQHEQSGETNDRRGRQSAGRRIGIDATHRQHLILHARTALPTRSAATTVNHCLVRSSSRNRVIAQMKLATSVTNIRASHRKLR